MSLKAFHIFFITISTILALAFGGWQVMSYTQDRVVSDLFMAAGAFVCGGLLIWYGRWFVHKIQGVS